MGIIKFYIWSPRILFIIFYYLRKCSIFVIDNITKNLNKCFSLALNLSFFMVYKNTHKKMEFKVKYIEIESLISTSITSKFYPN